MVATPIFGDQWLNAQTIRQTNVGRMLLPDNVDSVAIDFVQQGEQMLKTLQQLKLKMIETDDATIYMQQFNK